MALTELNATPYLILRRPVPPRVLSCNLISVTRASEGEEQSAEKLVDPFNNH